MLAAGVVAAAAAGDAGDVPSGFATVAPCPAAALAAGFDLDTVAELV